MKITTYGNHEARTPTPTPQQTPQPVPVPVPVPVPAPAPPAITPDTEKREIPPDQITRGTLTPERQAQ